MRLIGRQQASSKSVTMLVTILLAVALVVPEAAAGFPAPPPVPHVDAISPVSVAPGGNGFTLTVTGAGFVAASAVFWGTTQLATTFVSPVKLTAIVSAAMIETAGTGWITVVTPPNQCIGGGGTSNVMYLPVIETVPSLTFVESLNAGAPSAWGVIAGDFNKDGMLDVVTANRGSNTVTVYLGNGNGTFQAGQTITVFTGPFSLAVGDVNNDGKLDFVVSSLFASGSGGVAVLLGNGDGTFQAPTIFTTDHGASESVAVADVNGDGNLDLLAGSGAGGIDVFLGNGDGTFVVPVTYGATLGGIDQVQMADMNGDGRLDIVVANEGVVAILLGNGDGTFQSPVSVSAPGSVGVVIADFDGDNKLDVVASSFNGATSFLKGNGDGTIQDGVTIATEANRGISMGDFNGDGKLDIVTQNATGQKLDFYIGNGDGTFQEAQSFGSDVGPQFTFAVGNFAIGAGLAVAAAGNGSNMVLFQTAVTVSPAVVDFGSLAVGSTSDSMTVTVTNSTPVPVTISGITIVEAGLTVDFHQVSTTCIEMLGVNASCVVQVTFAPTVTGALAASVEVNDDAPGSPQSATLSGTGVNAPAATLSTLTLMFASQGVGMQSAEQLATLTNTGSATLTIASIAITGANPTEFAESNNCTATMAPDATCTFHVTFTPGASGARAAAITITDDAAGSPHSIALTGSGAVLGTASLSVNTLTFAATVSGSSSATQMVTLTNTGGTPLAITSFTLGGTNPGDFLKSTTCGATLAANASCTITVTFKPTAGGARAATILLVDGASDSPQSVTLSGTGEDFTLNVTTLTQTITSGGTANFQMSVTPQGGFVGLITLVCTGAPRNSTCMVMPTSFTPGGAPTNVAVSLVTEAQLFNPPSFSPPRQVVTRLPAFPALLWLLTLAALWTIERRGASFGWARTVRFAILVGSLTLAGCGSTTGVIKGSHALTITASSGSLSHNAVVTVIVQ
ncbi:MAG: FG-GAP-like repeat-containing protein [Candidatus Acidiferrales bacterium]